MATIRSPRPAALGTLYAGTALTVCATIAPYVDREAGQVLADHIRDGYPRYTQRQVHDAVTTWLAALTAVGVLGLAGWTWTIWAVTRPLRWAPSAATAMFVLGITVSSTALLVKDTSGEPGLAPLFGWLGLLPCAPGLLAVLMLRRPPS